MQIMGYDKMNLDDKIFRFIYIEAMRDAVIQLSYKGEKKWLMKLDFINSLKDEIEPLVNKVLNNDYSSQEEYDKDFLLKTISICKTINDKAKNNNFTFGNAQKLINIIIKHFYITSYKDDISKKKFKFCHCPMDRLLLENIWSKRKELDNDKILGNRDYFLKSWGNENFEVDETGKKMYPKRYMLFQQAVRFLAQKDGINPLEYDYCVW